MIERIIPIFTTDETKPVVVSAAQRVFSVGELCEPILLYADPADIVRCRAVNRKLFETVTYSKALRQRLFLEADHDRDRSVNSLAPSWFSQQPHRPNTIGVRLDLLDLWRRSLTGTCPLWQNMLISQPPTTTCVISNGDHITVYYQRYYPNGMTFGDLEKAVIAAFDIKKGLKSTPEHLDYLSSRNSVLIYWPSKPAS